MKNGQETKTSIRLETAAEETEMETDADMPEEAGGEPCTLLFAGDVYLSEHVLGAHSRAGNITGVLDQGILKETLGADIFMVNQEFPFTDRGTKAADKAVYLPSAAGKGVHTHGDGRGSCDPGQ